MKLFYRSGGKSVLKEFEKGDRSKRIVKYYYRLIDLNKIKLESISIL